MNFNIGQPDKSLGYLLWQTTMQWQKKANRELLKIGLTHTQFVILMSLAWLLQSSKDVSQKEIADDSNTDRMMVSKILTKLESSGFVTRKKHISDSRSKCISLTDTGSRILKEAIEIKKRENELFFSKLKNKEEFSNNLKLLIDFD